MPHYCCWC